MDDEESQIKVYFSNKLEKKIRILVDNHEEEVGGFLTGESRDGKIILQDILIPNQDISGGMVEIEGKDQVKLRKEYGNKCLSIIGHWHSHNTMTSFFSATDDENHEKLLLTRDFMVFVVSSRNNRHGVAIGISKPIKAVFPVSYELVTTYSDIEQKSLMKEIKKKCRKKIWPLQKWSGWGKKHDYGYEGYGYNNSYNDNFSQNAFDDEYNYKNYSYNIQRRKDGAYAVLIDFEDEASKNSFEELYSDLIESTTEHGKGSVTYVIKKPNYSSEKEFRKEIKHIIENMGGVSYA